MANTRKLSKFELVNLVGPASSASASGTRKIDAFDLEALRGNRPTLPAIDEPPASARPTAPPPTDLPADLAETMGPLAAVDPSTLVDAPLASSNASAISIPPAAVEITLAEPSVSGEQSEPRPEVEPGPTTDVEPTDPRQLKTRLARRFSTLADDVNEHFAQFFIGVGGWTVELSSPEGMSTSNGKEALQHLRMLPQNGGFPILLAGVVNAVERTAELRDYEHITSVHEARFGRPLPIKPAEWEQLLRRCEVALAHAKIQSVRTPPDARSRMAGSSKTARRLLGAVAAILLVVVALVLKRALGG